MATVALRSITRDFGGPAPAVDQVSLEVAEGSVLSLLGPSGCGKTTTLRMIAGLERPDSGEIRIGDRVVSAPVAGVHVPPERRGIGMVFQSYAIWPHLSVFDNVAYPLKMRKSSRAEIERRVGAALELVGMGQYAKSPPSQLSGGMQQRVAIARSLVFEPSVLLMDEPFSGLDARLREHLGSELRGLHDQLKVTTVYVTHDQSEALLLSDRVAVMHQGHVLQEGTPRELYFEPRNRTVADFLGFSTQLSARVLDVHKQRASALVRVAGDGWYGCCSGLPDTQVGQDVRLAIRPDALEVLAGAEPSNCPSEQPGVLWTGTVTTNLFVGSRRRLTVALGTAEVRVETRPELDGAQPGDRVTLWAPAERVWAFTDADQPQRT